MHVPSDPRVCVRPDSAQESKGVHVSRAQLTGDVVLSELRVYGPQVQKARLMRGGLDMLA